MEERPTKSVSCYLEDSWNVFGIRTDYVALRNRSHVENFAGKVIKVYNCFNFHLKDPPPLKKKISVLFETRSSRN